MSKFSVASLSKKYKLGVFKINKLKRALGYANAGRMSKDEYTELEASVKKYAKDNYRPNTLSTEERCKIVLNRLKADGYIKSKDITALFNGRHISGSVTVIENILEIELYEDTLKELRAGKTEESKSEDKHKYKHTRIYRDMAEWLKQCEEEAKIDCRQKNGMVRTGQSNIFRSAI